MSNVHFCASLTSLNPWRLECQGLSYALITNSVLSERYLWTLLYSPKSLLMTAGKNIDYMQWFERYWKVAWPVKLIFCLCFRLLWCSWYFGPRGNKIHFVSWFKGVQREVWDPIKLPYIGSTSDGVPGEQVPRWEEVEMEGRSMEERRKTTTCPGLMALSSSPL